MEIGNWGIENPDDSVLTVKPYLTALSTMSFHPFMLDHSYIDSKDAFYNKQNSFGSCPLVYCTFHGQPGALTLNAFDGIGLDEVVYPFETSSTETKRVLYFGACSIFAHEEGQLLAENLLKKSGCRAVIGYTRTAYWFDGHFTDMLFIQRFYEYADPFGNLYEIFNSVINDFAPARKIGLKMFA